MQPSWHRIPAWQLEEIASQMYWALAEVEDYFEQRQDIHHENPNAPNEEMRHLTTIRDALAMAEGKK